jgi:hypothetical protein
MLTVPARIVAFPIREEGVEFLRMKTIGMPAREVRPAHLAFCSGLTIDEK